MDSLDKYGIFNLKCSFNKKENLCENNNLGLWQCELKTRHVVSYTKTKFILILLRLAYKGLIKKKKKQ